MLKNRIISIFVIIAFCLSTVGFIPVYAEDTMSKIIELDRIRFTDTDAVNAAMDYLDAENIKAIAEYADKLGCSETQAQKNMHAAATAFNILSKIQMVLKVGKTECRKRFPLR